MDAWRKPIERPNSIRSWPEDHEKSTQNHLDGRNALPRNSGRLFDGATATPKPRTGANRPPTGPAAPQQVDGQARIRVPVNLVVVPVIVKDAAGRIVADLRKDEFRILEDKVEQRVSYFSAEAFPLSMVVLIDNDLKSKDAKQVTDSLRNIVAGLSASDETFGCP